MVIPSRAAVAACRLALLSVVIPLATLLGGCASYLSAQVTSFHQMTPEKQFAGRRFAIEPTPEQRDSLEFRAYADLVRRALVERGLEDATGGAADLAVAISYTVDSGKPMVYSYPAYGYANYGPVWGWTPYLGPGGHVHYVQSVHYPLGYGVVGTHYGQSIVYRRELRVDITDRRTGADGAKLFESTVISEGESASLAPVMPAMVKALFSDFPGPSGVSRSVQVRLGDPRTYP